MVAFDEQYAALMATMLRSAGIPARVVVGFVPSPESLSELATGTTVEVYEADIEAWVEVPFDGHGWVAFDAGPPDTQTEEIDDGSTDAQKESIFATPPPPPTSTTSTTIPQADEEEDEETENEQSEAGGLPTLALAGALAITVPIALFGLAAALIILLKARRRTRRRNSPTPSEQVFGAYRDLVDRSLDTGLMAPPDATARQTIALLAGDEDDPMTRGGSLVAVIEDAGYSAVEPEPSAVEAAWDNSKALVARFDADRTALERVKARLSVRSLRTPERGGT